ncbi:MAG: DUF885 family protein [Christensenellaceae bacterium]|nr:DUF885 family protein [Christensenellaceae bacterium]
MKRRKLFLRCTAILAAFALLGLLCSCQPVEQASAPAAAATFEEFAAQAFAEAVSADTLTLNRTLADPAAYGITAPAVTYGQADFSEKGVEAKKEHLQARLTALAAFERDDLPPQQQKVYDLLYNDYQLTLEACDYTLFYEPFSPEGGLQQTLPVALSDYRLTDAQAVEDYFELLSQTWDHLDAHLELEERKADEGRFMDRITAAQVVAQCRCFVEDPQNNMLITTFDARMDAAEGFTAAEKADYKAQNKKAVERHIIPAFEKLADRLEKLSEKSREPLGLMYTPGGKEYYSHLLKAKVGTDKDSAALAGLLDAQLEAAMDELNGLPMDSYIAYIDEEDIYGGMASENMLQKLLAAAESDLAESCTVLPMREGMSALTGAVHVVTSPIDQSFSACIYVDEQAPAQQRWAELAGEAVPGVLYRHVCHRAAQPMDAEYMFGPDGFDKAWALYAQLSAYSSFAFDDANYAAFEAVNVRLDAILAARIDLGVNMQGWKQDKVADYLEANGFDAGMAQELIDRAVACPAAALEGCVGMLELNDILARQGGQTGIEALAGAGKYPYGLLAPAE